MAEDLAFPNGMAVTADGGTLVVADSYRHQLVGFTIADDGSLSERRVWADLGDHDPDGICLDADGAAWYADVPHQVCVRVAEGGEVLDTVDLDRGGFACMLGGDATPALYVVAAVWPGAAGLMTHTDWDGQVLRQPVAVPGRGLARQAERVPRARLPRPRPPPPLPTGVAAARRRRRARPGDPARAAGHGVRRARRAPPDHRPLHHRGRAAGVCAVRTVTGARARAGLIPGPGDRGDDLAVAPAGQHPGRGGRLRVSAGAARRRADRGRGVVAVRLRRGPPVAPDAAGLHERAGADDPGQPAAQALWLLRRRRRPAARGHGVRPWSLRRRGGRGGGRPRRGLPGAHPADPTMGADGSGRAGGRASCRSSQCGCSTSPATASTWSGSCRRASRR